MGFAQDLALALGHRPSVLIIEDDEGLASDLSLFMDEQGWRVDITHTLADALQKVTAGAFDLILADYFLPDNDVLPLFDEVKKRSPITKILVITGARDNRETPLHAFRSGAADFVYKPFTLEELEERICELLHERRLYQRTRKLPPGASPCDEIIGQSEVIQTVRERIEKICNSDLSVMITGETGTGKELVARAIHKGSPRCSHSFVPINCAAVPENLLEDELFGHTPGAYTDARNFRQGRFEEANKGTLFLDEIGDMPHSLQAKLLRVLEDGMVRKLGTNRIFEVDTRVLAATNSDLWQKVQEGGFRKDLYYRLRMVHIDVPTLRERREDIPILVHYFLERMRKESDLDAKQVDSAASGFLMAHDWPGNVRELRNVVEVAALLSGDRSVLTMEDFELGETASSQLDDEMGSVARLPKSGVDLKRLIEDLEHRLINQSLERTGGNKQEAARLLSIKRTTLLAKLRKMDQSAGLE